MITNYEEFLVEKTIYQSINESVFYITPKFAEILKEIDSPISKFLLQNEQQDIPVSSNYLDVDSKETISFISDQKAQRLLNDPEKGKVYMLIEEGHVLDIDKLKYKIEYNELLSKYGDPNDIVDNKFEKNPDEIPDNQPFEKVGNTFYYNVELSILKFDDKFVLTLASNVKEAPAPYYKNRQTIRVGRGIRAILNSLKQNFTDAEIEDFVNKWKAAYDHLQNEFRDFEIVKGDDIAHWYYYENYELETYKGTLSSSCMCKKPGYFFDIYSDNPEVCSLVILKSSKNKIKGRALLWKLNDDRMFMDRVYTHFDSDFALFEKFAKHNGWLRKASQNSSANEKIIAADGVDLGPIELVVKINVQSYRSYPYLDTLKYLTEYSEYYTLSNDQEGAEWELESTSGNRVSLTCETCNGSGEITCDDCEGDGETSNECESCEGSGEVRCEECRRGGEIDCEECSGTGSIEDDEGDEKECEECGGSGNTTCPDCNRGWITCSDCNGDGAVEQRCTGCRGRGIISCPDC